MRPPMEGLGCRGTRDGMVVAMLIVPGLDARPDLKCAVGQTERVHSLRPGRI